MRWSLHGIGLIHHIDTVRNIESRTSLKSDPTQPSSGLNGAQKIHQRKARHPRRNAEPSESRTPSIAGMAGVGNRRRESKAFAASPSPHALPSKAVLRLRDLVALVERMRILSASLV
jgi:hypothetical protein